MVDSIMRFVESKTRTDYRPALINIIMSPVVVRS